MPCPLPSPAGSAAAFLADLAAGGPLRQRTALVVAHPDDEAIGAGGQIARYAHLALVVASDGAPRDGRDARRLGFSSSADYARARRAELREALRRSGAADVALVALDLPDGELVFALDEIIAALADLFVARRIEVALTHAYEGGHPDHDALALATRLAARRCATPPAIVEMPYYRADATGWAIQSFADDAGVVHVALDDAALARKHAMIDAHATQADLLSGFRRPVESFRAAPDLDLDRLPLPNDGRLLYADVAPSLDPQVWLARARAAAGAREEARA